MNNFKKFVLKYYRKNSNFAMRCMPLLMNITNMEQASEIIYVVLVTFQCRHLNIEASQILNNLIIKLNAFSVDVSVHTNFESLPPSDSLPELQPNRYTEEHFIALADKSPFKKWGYDMSLSITEKFVDCSDASLQGNNQYFSEHLSKHFLSRLIPILPMWTALNTEKLSSAASINNVSNCVSARTNGLAENRFRILKFVCMSGNKTLRLDDFSVELFPILLIYRECLLFAI